MESWSIRPEEDQEKEIWFPNWNCFCCQDTGKVQLNLARLVIPNYNDNRDRLPICQNVLETSQTNLNHWMGAEGKVTSP
ncbi:hypothetical protein [Scytonema sp. NUACC21]